MDLSQLSNNELIALKNGDLSKLSDKSLMALRDGQPSQPPRSLFDQAKQSSVYAPFFTADELIRKAANVAGEKGAELMAGQTTLNPSNPLTGKPILKKPLTFTNPKPINPIIAAGIGTAAQMAPDIIQAVATPVENADQTLNESAQNQGLRAQGYTKRFVNTMPKEDRARQSVQTILDNTNIIRPGATAESMVNETSDLAKKTGKNIENYLNSVTTRGKYFDTKQAIAELNSLRPTGDEGQLLQGGWYADANNKIDKAIETIQAHGNEPITFTTANKIKGMFQDAADFTKKDPMGLTDRIIAGKFRDFIDQSLADVSQLHTKGKYLQFLKDKQLYSAAMNSIDPLYNRLSSELGNRAASLTDFVLAAGELGAGNPLRAAALVGGKKVLEKYAAPTSAYVLNKAARAGLPAPPQFGAVGFLPRAAQLGGSLYKTFKRRNR